MGCRNWISSGFFHTVHHLNVEETAFKSLNKYFVEHEILRNSKRPLFEKYEELTVIC